MSTADAAVKKFDTATDKSTKALVTATAGLTKVLADLATQADVNAFLAEQVQLNQATLNDLDAQLAMKVREHNADLAMRIRENEEQVIIDLLNKTGRADISANALNEVYFETDTLKEKLDSNTEEVSSRLQKEFERQLEAAAVEAQSSHSVQSAELKAENTSLRVQNEQLVQQAAAYKEMLDNEREARVSQADALARAAEANRPVAAPSR